MTEKQKAPIWRSIAEAVQHDIDGGVYRSGDKLPTEAALARRFGVNRHTVRAALAHLAAAGIVHARRGSGVYVAQVLADYRLGSRVRFHQNIAASGRLPSRQITRMETVGCQPEEGAALGLAAGQDVHVVEGLSLADGQPLAMFRSVFPGRIDGLMQALAQDPSVTVALARCGVGDYTRAHTRITAHLADGLQALALRINQGAPLLRTVAVNVDVSGAAVEYGTTWFAADRVALVMGAEDALSQILCQSAIGTAEKG